MSEARQRHYIQVLRLAKAGMDVHLGSYVLGIMAVQAMMRGFTSEAVDMTGVPPSQRRWSRSHTSFILLSHLR